MTSLLVFALSSVASAEGPEPLAPFIIGGEETEEWPAVVSLEAVFPSGRRAGFCTGTLVGDRWVLTAAHCVAATEKLDVDFVVAFGSDLSRGAPRLVRWAASYRLGDGDPKRVVHGYDLALIELEQPVEVTPIQLRTTPLGPDIVGSEVVLVGYGTTVGVDAGVPPIRRTARVDVEALLPQLLVLTDDQSSACYGDSGGPVLDETGRSILAVTSFGVADCNPRLAAGTRVDANIDWIEAIIDGDDPQVAEAYAGGADEACSCATSGRMAGAGTGIAMASVLLRRSRRRRGT
jgi:secreted trypsin-like serine protease